MWRYMFLYFCSAPTFLICGLIVNTAQIILFFTVKPFSKYLYRRINYYLCYTYFSIYIFFVDWYSGSEIVIYMDKNDYKRYFGKEHTYIISNHTYEIDWLMLLSLSDKAHCAGNSKTFIKNVVQYVPGFGNVLYFADYICLARSFAKDKTTIETKIKEIVDYPDPIWLVLYPEGTRFTQDKYEKSMKFAKENDLPILKHHLSPRTKGFVTSLPPMNNKMDALYDITIAFDPADKIKPTASNIFFGRKMKVYFYINRICFNEIPKDEDGATRFIHDLFIKKDKMCESFLKTGDFFTESGIEKVESFKLKRNYSILISALAWYTFSLCVIVYYLINLLIAGNTFNFALSFGSILMFALLLHRAMAMTTIEKGNSNT